MGKQGSFSSKIAFFTIAFAMLAGLCTRAQATPSSSSDLDLTNLVLTRSFKNLFSDVDRIMTALGAKLPFNEKDWLTLSTEAHELTDPQSMPKRAFTSAYGRPLPYYVFEPAQCGSTEIQETVLFIGGMHADEVAPLYASFRELMLLMQDPVNRPKNTRIIYVPLANPDGLVRGFDQAPFEKKQNPAKLCQLKQERHLGVKTKIHRSAADIPTRFTGEKIDLNRSLSGPNNQIPEARFIVELIAKYSPNYVISLHGPFGWLDYDGPANVAKPTTVRDRGIRDWLKKAATRGNLVERHSVATEHNSLGAYGKKRGLHVVTIEFPNECGTDSEQDWKEHGPAIDELIAVPVGL